MAGYGRELCLALIGAVLVKLAIEASLLRHLWKPQNTPMKRSAQLMLGELSAVTKSRFICGFAGGVVLPWMLISLHGQASVGNGRDWFLALGGGQPVRFDADRRALRTLFVLHRGRAAENAGRDTIVSDRERAGG